MNKKSARRGLKNKCALFEDSPISLWEEDFSGVKRRFDAIKAGDGGIGKYLRDNPRAVRRCASLVRIIDVNRATVTMYKAKSKKHLLKNLRDVFTPESYEVFREEIIAFAEGKTAFEGEAVNKTLTGEKLYTFIKCNVAPGCEESLSRVFVSIIDITKLKKSEDTLRTLKQQLEFILDTTKTRLSIIDSSYNIKYVDPGWQKSYGAPGGKKCYAYFHNMARPCPSCTVMRAIREGRAVVSEERLVKEDNKPTQVTTIPFVDEKGERMAAEVRIDITRRKKAVTALRRSEMRFRLVARATNEAIWDWDILTNKVWWNDVVYTLFGYTPEEVGNSTKWWEENIHPEDRKRVLAKLQAVIDGGGDAWLDEYRFRRKDGAYAYVLDRGFVIHDRLAKPVRMIGSMVDITKRRDAEEILKKDKRRLSDVGTLAATIAHELRNPLGVIRTALYNIKRKRVNPQIDKHIANIEKKIAESDQIINNLLDYSRIKIPQFEKVDIHGVLDECLEEAQKSFYNCNVAISKRLKTVKNMFIEADPFQIREVFNNILSNAYQSMADKKGKIEVAAGFEGKDSIRIAFRDNGTGIDKEDLDKIFDPFFTRRSRGTGLGLTVCNDLVHLHNGAIDIESEKGSGTVVTITLPVRQREGVGGAHEQEAAYNRGR